MAIRSSALVAVSPGPAAVYPSDECAGAQVTSDAALDHFITENGVVFAGHHLIIDCFGAHGLDDLELMEAAMRQSVDAAGATLLHIHLHHFTPNGGISGVAVLAESHISVHTWPERDFAAFDVFMCGDAAPERVVDVLRQAFAPQRLEVGKHRRGVLFDGSEAEARRG